LFTPRGGYGALFIVVKRCHNAVVSPNQAAWHNRLRNAGYAVVVAYGATEAIAVIESYLRGE